MRKFLLFTLIMSIGMICFAQERAVVPKEIRNVSAKKAEAIKGPAVSAVNDIPGTNYKSILAEDIIGTTWYDVQSNRGMQTRVYMHSDGTKAGVWTRGPENNPSGPNRGTGYNFFDGNNWGPDPTSSLEWTGAQAGWPSYTTWGENGEAYVCHDYFEGTILGTCIERGTGDWTQVIQTGPPGAEDISFPRIVTTGPDRNMIHILSTTWVEYNGQETALLYARTSDAGSTWEVENQTFDIFGPDYTLDVGPDVYNWADPKGDLIAFLVGDNWMDLVLMKSYDDGESWDETVIWECPYPLNPIGNPTDTFFCPDGAHHLAIDDQGLVHVVFGLTGALDDGEGQGYFPGYDGVVYWNENRPTFSNDVNALNPYDDAPYTELEVDYSLIGWSQDVDGDGVVNLLPGINEVAYNTGVSSQPQIIVDELNRIFIIFSSLTEGYEYQATSNFRHIWVRSSPNGGEWWGDFHDMNTELIYLFSECAFPSASPTSDDYIYFIYQEDDQPGTSTNASTVNEIRFMSVLKDDIISGTRDKEEIISSNRVSQNFPNPFSETSTVHVVLDEPADLSLEVTNIMGQIVYQIPVKRYSAGKHEMMINGTNLESGVYFYTVRSGENAVTKKMVIE